MQNFFFIGKSELQDNVFSADLKIADFWQRIDDKRKNELLKEPLKQMIRDLLRDYNESHKPFDNIAESAECEEDVDEVNSSSRTKSDFDPLEYDQAMDYLRQPLNLDYAKTGSIQTGMMPLTSLPVEYTEFNGQQLIEST